MDHSGDITLRVRPLRQVSAKRIVLASDEGGGGLHIAVLVADVLVARAGGAEALVAQRTVGESAVERHVVSERLPTAVGSVTDVAAVAARVARGRVAATVDVAEVGCAGQRRQTLQEETVATPRDGIHDSGTLAIGVVKEELNVYQSICCLSIRRSE